MNKCNCKQPERIGVHLATCEVFKDLTFEDFKEHALYFRDIAEDLLKYAKGFEYFIDERPEFYAAAMHSELITNLNEVFAADYPRETIDAMITVHEQWFATHFTPQRLTALQKGRVIAQEYGFATSTLISFKVDAHHFFGFY